MPIDQKKIDEIVKLRKQGLTYEQIAEQANVTPNIATYHASKGLKKKKAAYHKAKKQLQVKRKKAYRSLPAELNAGTSPTTNKPMVAVIGTPSEISQAIKEMFS